MYTPVGWAVVDHNSKNGVFVNNQRITDKEFLMPMDVIRIAGYHFIFTGSRLIYQAERQYVRNSEPSFSHEKGMPPVSAGGQSSYGTVPLSNPLGRRMSQVSGQNSMYKGSSGEPICAPYPSQPLYYPVGPSLNIHIEKREVWQSFRKKTLLENIDIHIKSGSLVLILGGSGAGKTTFIQAVMGYEKAQGKIIYKGQDMYREYRKMQYEIGYVPQADLLRGSDSTYKTLENALDNKLKVDSHSEKERKVMEALRLFGLTEQRNTIVSQLSGGEKKRLSTACEYITGPSLFFLDEPDSGLDAASSEQLMRELREVADEGKIILVISHSPNRVAQYFDQVIVLAKGEHDNIGHLAFTGPLQEALRFFETPDLESIVKRINPVEEGGEGKSDYYISLFDQSRRSGRPF